MNTVARLGRLTAQQHIKQSGFMDNIRGGFSSAANKVKEQFSPPAMGKRIGGQVGQQFGQGVAGVGRGLAGPLGGVIPKGFEDIAGQAGKFFGGLAGQGLGTVQEKMQGMTNAPNILSPNRMGFGEMLQR